MGEAFFCSSIGSEKLDWPTRDNLQQLVESLPRRVQAVIAYANTFVHILYMDGGSEHTGNVLLTRTLTKDKEVQNKDISKKIEMSGK